MGTGIHVRSAKPEDLAAIAAFDELHDVTAAKIAAGEVWVALVEDGVPGGGEAQVVGYARFNYTFFWKGWAATLVVAPSHRRRGVASALLRHLESICTAPKVFISTALSNLAMQGVLQKCGYKLTGVIDDLGPEPELIYFKPVARKASL